MDFFDREARAQKQTRRLLWLFSLAVLAVVFLSYLMLASIIWIFQHPMLHEVWWNPMMLLISAFFFYAGALVHPLQSVELIWDLLLFCWLTTGTLILIAAGCYYKIRLLSGGGSAGPRIVRRRKNVHHPPR